MDSHFAFGFVEEEQELGLRGWVEPKFEKVLVFFFASSAPSASLRFNLMPRGFGVRPEAFGMGFKGRENCLRWLP